MGMFVIVFLCGGNRVRRNRHDETAVLHAFKADQQVSKVLDARGFTVHDEHFKTGIVIKMSVACGSLRIASRLLSSLILSGAKVRSVLMANVTRLDAKSESRRSVFFWISVSSSATDFS